MRSHLLNIFVYLLALSSHLLAHPVMASEVVNDAIIPNLSVDIPGVSFSKVLEEGGVLQINFLADYVSGVYIYLLQIGTIIAIIMIMIGGLQWTLSGGSIMGDYQKSSATGAKKRISNAVSGLVLLICVSMILYIVNPNLVGLKSIELENLEKVVSQQVAKEWSAIPDTSGSGSYSSTTTGGSHTPAFTSCPITLSGSAFKAPKNAEEDPRNREFFSGIGSVITGATTAERIAQISDAAAVCDVRFGSCGKTIETIAALAGTGNQSCLTQGDTCRTYEGLMPQAHQIPLQDILQLSGFVCGEGCGGNWVADNADCEQKFSETAISKAAQLLIKSQGADYPDNWVNDLQPGDVIWYYNANSSCGGLHSVIFLGQASNGLSQVISGSMNRNAKGHTACLSTSCANMRPIVRVFRAR